MKPLRLETLALATLLASLTMAVAQQPAAPQTTEKKQPPSVPGPPTADPKTPAPTTLDQLLQQALRDNPDIRVGEAKVHSAEAELHRTRLAVTQKVVAAHSAVVTARANVARWEAEYARLLRLSKDGVVDPNTIQDVQPKLLAAKAELAMAEAQLPYLTGQPAAQRCTRFSDSRRDQCQRCHSTSGREVDPAVVKAMAFLAPVESPYRENAKLAEWLARTGKQGPMADKLRAALDKPFSFEDVGSVANIVDSIKTKHPELVIQVRVDEKIRTSNETVRFKDVPLIAVLQWCEDVVPEHRFVVREYGLLLAPVKDLPPGAVYLTDFWKAGTVDKDKEKHEAPKGTPEKR